MKSDEISQIRDSILAQNPEIPKASITDEKIREADMKLKARFETATQGNAFSDQPEKKKSPSVSDPAPLGASLENITAISAENPTTDGERLEALLEELSGNSNTFRTDSKTLGSDVSKQLGL